VVTMLLTYLSAVFYPITMLSEQLRWFLYVNPLYHHLALFRSFSFGEGFSWISLGVVVGSAVVSFALGIWVFSRNWRNVVISL
jgi:ABC-type polysaccharide/polyol phosphate export permease